MGNEEALNRMAVKLRRCRRHPNKSALITFEDTTVRHTARMRIVVLNGGFAWTGNRWVRLDECVHSDEV